MIRLGVGAKMFSTTQVLGHVAAAEPDHKDQRNDKGG